MKLIKGKDYYDSALAFGRDESIIFVRKSETLSRKDARERQLSYTGMHWTPTIYMKNHRGDTMKNHRGDTIKKDMSTWKHPDGHSITMDAISILLAGKLYRGLKTTKKAHWTHGSLSDEIEIFWTKDSFTRYMNKHDMYPFQSESFTHPNSTIDMYFLPDNQTQQKTMEFMIEHKMSIMTVDDSVGEWHDPNGYVVIDGDNLKDYCLQKIVGPYTVMQELSMWIGGILPRPEKEIITINDKNKISKHGFDKWSFRKMPK
ncbi:hypothetical protein EVB94_005 [Rhizobium phage RHph_TM40]|uniref:Uncharacterized protein n=1 Tax=Rhizobium phage RHph_TM30 TaxID=2509764 RepID=A0A7S5R4S4_9CAUD|nr:hypothetical protein PQC16_gp005 [Rhizobium phage RHph_TM30]QIG71112.1 hypothetical protein EVB93_005 [Rhizobium phage RHph_TM30]QIG71476.1 hypothetical protein EVB94_005 [Rhizobium phage RHph_TM40]QIG72201.1 hypothetical protein EVB96_005 [Rhizobium phage RHph_TM3_3_6]